MASSGSPGDVLAASDAWAGASGTNSSISLVDIIRGTFGCLPDRLQATGPGLLAGAARGLLSGQLPGVSDPEVPLGTLMGSGGHGPSGHVCYDSEG